MTIAPIQRARVDNFRAIRCAEIALHPRVTVFFGANAAGKSTVLDAIAIGLGAIPARVSKGTGRSFVRSGDLRTPWRDRLDLGELRGVERPFARVAMEAAGGRRWDVTMIRSAQDRQHTPSGVGTKALHDALDPLVKAALDASPGTVTDSHPPRRWLRDRARRRRGAPQGA